MGARPRRGARRRPAERDRLRRVGRRRVGPPPHGDAVGARSVPRRHRAERRDRLHARLPTQAASVADRFVTALDGDPRRHRSKRSSRPSRRRCSSAIGRRRADAVPPLRGRRRAHVTTDRSHGRRSDVDLLIGTTRDEMRMYLDPGPPRLDRERLVRRTAPLPLVAGRARRTRARRSSPATTTTRTCRPRMTSGRRSRPTGRCAGPMRRARRRAHSQRPVDVRVPVRRAARGPARAPARLPRVRPAVPVRHGRPRAAGPTSSGPARRGRPLGAGGVDRVRTRRRPVVRAARCVARLRHRPPRHDAARRRVAARRRSRRRLAAGSGPSSTPMRTT